MMAFSNSILLLLLWGTTMIDSVSGDDRTLARRAMMATSQNGEFWRGKVRMRPTRNPTKRPTASRQSKAFLASGNSSDLEVVTCSTSSVEVGGLQAGNVTAGTFFIYLQDGEVGCTACSPLFRYVESVQKSAKGTFVLSTRFATVAEILDERAGSGIANVSLEPLGGCSHSGSTSPMLASDKSQPLTNSGTCDKEPCHSYAESAPQPLLGECADSWLQKNSDGRCSFTNCFVCTDGNPDDCFICKRQCDNGCGASGSIFNTDGNFFLFDFGLACCNHDYCWSSTLTRSECDSNFYNQMKAQCRTPIVKLTTIFFPLPLQTPLKACYYLASAFYLAVHYTGAADDAYNKAQADQKDYEETSVCIAKCPSTQESGGQGTTVLTIDLIVQNGTFPVSYQMYTIPDQLYIEYEGQRIFDTGGLVSDSGAADVTYSGTSTIIQVTINAPNSGTAWDVFVGCPYGL